MIYRDKTGDTYSGDYFDHLVERFGLERLGLEEINESSTEIPTENEDTPTEEDNMDKHDSQTGLCVKYDVKKVETGETVNNCFVLRPDKDPAAVAALRTYARATPNKALADDIIAWVGADTADKPRLAEVLGVEVGERFGIEEFGGNELIFYLDRYGVLRWADDNGTSDTAIYTAINHPESIIRAPRLTEPEIAIMRALGAKWVSRDKGFDDVYLWSDKPKVSKDYEEYYIPSNPGDCISSTQARLFPSVKSGDCIELEDDQ